jgi:16S rRNA (cytosine1402-N4)-methyltransferase
MVSEVVDILLNDPDGVYVDGTVGGGGHSEAIIKGISNKGFLICMDRDSEAIRFSRERLKPFAERVICLKANYADLNNIFRDLKIEGAHGIILDLGMSSYQLDHSGRGFSFNRDEPLDMRMDLNDEIDAKQLINSLSEKEIERMLRDYGEEKRARSVSRSIVRERAKAPIESSLRLAKLIRSSIPRPRRTGVKDPATRTFQALRIAVNKELENLKLFLGRVPPIIELGGRLVVIAYHSLEDRIVKQAMRDWEKGCVCPPGLPSCTCGGTPLFKRIIKKGLKPEKREIDNNPRARSAILRAAERI